MGWRPPRPVGSVSKSSEVNCSHAPSKPSSLINPYIGVYVKVVHKSATGLFGPSFTFKQNMVLKLEVQTP